MTVALRDFLSAADRGACSIAVPVQSVTLSIHACSFVASAFSSGSGRSFFDDIFLHQRMRRRRRQVNVSCGRPSSYTVIAINKNIHRPDDRHDLLTSMQFQEYV